MDCRKKRLTARQNIYKLISGRVGRTCPVSQKIRPPPLPLGNLSRSLETEANIVTSQSQDELAFLMKAKIRHVGGTVCPQE
jgi:hypothetical protein